MSGETRAQILLGAIALLAAIAAGFFAAVPVSLPEPDMENGAAVVLPELAAARPSHGHRELEAIVAMLDRRPPAPLPKVANVAAVLPEGPDFNAIRALKITGVILSPAKQIAIVGVPGEPEPRVMEEGERHAGWVLKRLAADSIEFVSGNVSERIWIWPE